MSARTVNRPVTAADLPAIAALHRKIFGPGRFARSAYRVREAAPAAAAPISRFCRLAMSGGRLVAALRFTAVAIGGQEGALLLGPLAVDPDVAGQGFGRALVADAIEAARADGIRLVVLVGDETYYGRFGFRPAPPGRIALPGPVDPARLLAAELVPDALADFRGPVAAT